MTKIVIGNPCQGSDWVMNTLIVTRSMVSMRLRGRLRELGPRTAGHPRHVPARPGKSLDELKAALAAIARERADGLFVYSSPVNEYNLDLIVEFAARNRVSTMFQACQHAIESDGLRSYFTDWIDLRRRTAAFVDKILKGAKPSELAIEQPTKFDLCVNLKTAKALGLTIPPSVMARADEVIQ